MAKIEQLREVELELLEQFIKVCEEHNLTWYAMFGTLLGAMRNRGFLIWDDDIDVVMPSGDYAKLCNHKEWFDERYFLQTPVDEGCHCSTKLRKNGTTAFFLPLLDSIRQGGHLGISIDIIPLAEVPGIGFYWTPTLKSARNTIKYPKHWFGQGKTAAFERLQVNIPSEPRKVLQSCYGIWAWPIGAEVVSPHYWFFDNERDFSIYIRRYTGWLDEVKGKKIYLFGAADSLRIWLERYGLREQVVCTFDNDPNKWDKESFGVEVHNPAEIQQIVDRDSIIIVVSLWYQEIGEQLERMGITDYFVFLDFLFECDSEGELICRESPKK